MKLSIYLYGEVFKKLFLIETKCLRKYIYSHKYIIIYTYIGSYI